MTGAKDVRMTAAAWLERRHRPDWSASDQADLTNWLESAPTNRIAYLRVEAAWNRANRLTALRQPMRAESPAHNTRRPAFRFMAIAAAALGALAVVTTLALQTSLAPTTKTFTTATGGHDILALPDGSKIELNTNSTIRVSQIKGERKVWLDKGEAYFKIKHDSARPFIVLVGDHRITDLGTTFLIRRESQSVKVALIEGLAQYESLGKSKQSTRLTPGDVLVASAEKFQVSKENAGQLTTGLSWRHGLLIFRYTTLADAAAEFNRYNDRKLVIADPAVGKLKIVGTFATNNVAAFADVAEDVLRLKVTHSENEIRITR